MNLPELLQQHFNYPPLQMIDPNTQEVGGKTESGHNEFGQAAIPAIVTGLYKLSRTDEGVTSIIRGEKSSDWVRIIFGDSNEQIIERVADYSGDSYEEVARKLNIIADKAAAIVKEETTPDYEIVKVKDILAAQRLHLLPYLPAVLQIGELLNDTTLDDKTNKMKGPASNLIKAIGNTFSAADEKLKP